MPYSQDIVVATGSTFEIAPIAFGSVEPERFVLTVGTAGVADDATLQLSADKQMNIRDGQRIDFVDGSYAIVAVTNTSDIFTIGTTPVSVPVQPLAGAVTAGTTAITKFRDMGFENKAIANRPYIYQYRLLLGTTDMSTVPTTATVDGTDLNSGYGANTAVVGNNVVATVNFNRKYNDRAFREVLDNICHDLEGTDIQRLVWIKATEGDGSVYEGPCRAALTGKSNASRQIQTATGTFSIEGNSYSYIPRQSELTLFSLT